MTPAAAAATDEPAPDRFASDNNPILTVSGSSGIGATSPRTVSEEGDPDERHDHMRTAEFALGADHADLEQMRIRDREVEALAVGAPSERDQVGHVGGLDQTTDDRLLGGVRQHGKDGEGSAIADRQHDA